ncbi:sugar phosphate isomerase/epimerase [Halobacillus sp. Marseille-P3879]|uniref:sugar phosphate isomerase/epimerase family protein n=1 Tax=Halobacillus sp. Marseille-P3879 TaxID=2045014 RepID=UPI000C79FD6E|nr:sugar phosphate isomerase/epimerase [Halobacillus sp. Marseille-P3879]
MKFSVFTVMTPDLKPEELVSSLRAFGYDGVEWRCTPIPEKVKRNQPSYWGNNLSTLDPRNTDDELKSFYTGSMNSEIEVVSVTPYLTCGDLQETERILQIANKIGAGSIRLGVPQYNRTFHYNDLFDQAVHYLYECEQLCKQYDVKGLVETHHNTIAASASSAYRLVSPFSPDHIGVLYDPGNMVIEGHENYRLGMELLGPYLAHVHAKNAAWVPVEKNEEPLKWESQWTSLPEGFVKWEEVIKDLKAVGYDGFIGMEDFSGKYETKEALQRNLAYFKQLLS